MISQNDLDSMKGTAVHDTSGDRIGTMNDIYYDDQTNQPAWATVNTGLFGTRQHFVPLHQAELDPEGRLVIPVTKDQVKEAPSIDEDGYLTDSQEAELYRHYNVTIAPADNSFANGDTGYRGVHERPEGDNAMTRSEERLNVGTEQVETGRARLRKHIVTEQQQVTVPVQREEVRLEHEPITDANRDAAYQGPNITESEHEVTLHAERPVVDKETVPVERVRLGTETISDQESVSGDVRQEQIELDDSTGTASERTTR